MAYQLIYTSSPVSLVHGRTGFSTVARSADMPEKLAAAVERCGAYDISSGVVYSHRIVFVGGQNWHILSRVCDAGVDYTNRNNYLAHHLAISETEIGELPNPAEILLNWDGWLSSWTQKPRLLGNVENLSAIRATAALPAKTWAEIFGDSGAAALLGGLPISVVADVGDAETLLKLFSESMLLNANKSDAWRSTFTTCHFESDNPSDFIWKTYRTRDGLNSPCADLKSKKIADVPNCRAAEYARTGELTNRERLNLTVAAPAPYEKKFNVVDTGQRNVRADGSFSKVLIFGAIGVSAVLVAAIFAFSYMLESGAETGDNFQPEKLPVLKNAASASAEKIAADSLAFKARAAEMSSLQIRSEIKSLIEKCDFESALKLWDASKYANNDPSYRLKILSDIGYKADALMRYCEEVFSSQMSSEAEKNQALKNLEYVSKALSLAEMPRAQSRAERLSNLKKKVER